VHLWYAVTGTGPGFNNPRDLLVDIANNRALVIDSGIDAVVAVDLASGDRTIISNSTTGTGQTFSAPENIVLHSALNRVLIADITRGLIAVDLASGDRTIVNQPKVDYGANSSRLEGVALDLARNNILVTDSTVDAIFSMDLFNGSRSILSDSDTYTSDELTVYWGIQGIAYDSSTEQLLLTDSEKDVLWTLDTTTGTRTLLSGPARGAGLRVDFPGKLDVDTANNLAYYVEQNTGALMVVDLATGDRTVISGLGVGAGPAFGFIRDVALDIAGNRALVSGDTVNGGALFMVDLATGDRTLVSDGVTGAGPVLTVAASVEYDAVNNRAIVMDWNEDILVAIDLATGNRTVLSDNAGIGIGTNFSVPFDMELDIEGNRVLVTDYGTNTLTAVDLTSGDRTSLVPFGNVQQLNLLNPYYVALDLDNNRAFVYDLSITGILVIELSTGERAVMAK